MPGDLVELATIPDEERFLVRHLIDQPGDQIAAARLI